MPAAPAAAAIAGGWGMDEACVSTAFDSSGNGNDGALTNVTLGSAGVTGADGDPAYLFGSTSSMRVPGSASLVAGSQDVTVTMSVKTSVRPGTGTLDFDLVSKGGYQVEIFPKNGLAQARCKFLTGTGKQVLFAGPTSPTASGTRSAATRTPRRSL